MYRIGSHGSISQSFCRFVVRNARLALSITEEWTREFAWQRVNVHGGDEEEARADRGAQDK